MQGLSRFNGRLEDGASLHLDDLGMTDEQSRTTLAEHRVEFVQDSNTPLELGDVDAHGFGNLSDGGIALGQKLMQRRVEQADGHGAPGHDLK